jgi:hypothetical protein
MGILIGMDEAGYGPNFGPLVVAATAWEVREEGSGFRVQGSELGESQSSRRRIDDCRSVSTIRNPQSAIRNADFDLYRLLRNIVAK